MTSCNL